MRRLSVILAIIALIVTACGNSEEAGDTTTAPEGTTAPGPTVPAEAGRLIFGAILIGVARYARQEVMGIIRPRKGSRRKI